jgi:hypothetical protein
MYKIGQVLHLVLQNKMKILPVQVVEEITKKTFGGEKTQYFVSTPDKSKEPINLDDFDGQVFKNLDEVRSFLLENITQNINKMIHRSAQIAKECFEVTEVSENENFTFPLNSTSEEETIQVDLGEGKVGNLRIKG